MRTAIQNPEVLEALIALVEEATMLFVEPVEDESIEKPDAYVLSRVRYHGVRDGEMSLAIPHGVLAEMAASQLGCDASEVSDESLLLDAAGELANLLAGRWLGDTAASDETIKLEKPTAEFGGEAAWDDLETDDHCAAILVEDEPMLVHITSEG